MKKSTMVEFVDELKKLRGLASNNDHINQSLDFMIAEAKA
jgi:hypothetical protein